MTFILGDQINKEKSIKSDRDFEKAEKADKKSHGSSIFKNQLKYHKME